MAKNVRQFFKGSKVAKAVAPIKGRQDQPQAGDLMYGNKDARTPLPPQHEPRIKE